MKKIAISAVFASLVMASVTPAMAATSRPTPAVVDAQSVLFTTPYSTYPSNSHGNGTSTAFDGYVATAPRVPDVQLYGGLLEYFKASLAYQGAVYNGFLSLGLKGSALSALTSAYAKLDLATANLIAYLQTTVTIA